MSVIVMTEITVAARKAAALCLDLFNVARDNLYVAR